MLQVASADALDALADELAAALTRPLDDPMVAEWLAVPSPGMARWLRIRLSRVLGAGGATATDGVAANLAIGFPGALRRAVLDADRPADDADPWAIERLVWTILAVLDEHGGDARLAHLTALPDGAPWYGRARRLADLFDRYAVHRPEMVRSWARGDDVDGAGQPLDDPAVWQPHLWRLVRARVGEPGSAERLPELLERLRAGDLVADLPPRLSFFGLTTLPGGAPFLDLVTAAAAHRDLSLFLFTPSPGMAETVHREIAERAAPRRPPHRVDPPVARLVGPVGPVGHPLLRSWARPNREALALLAGAQADGVVPPIVVATTTPSAKPVPPVDSLLARVQADLRAGAAPTADFVPDADDRSIEIHSCHGPSRQVEILRDAILHRLVADPTLREDEILVVCPAIDAFAPLVEAVLGPSADERHDRDEAAGVPRLSYRITDRSLRDSAGILGALATLVDLVGGRFPAAAMLDFLALPPVRLRFDLDDDDLATIARWADEAEIRWGLGGAHRGEWGIPGAYAVGSWRAVLDRLLAGIAIGDQGRFAVGDVLPMGVEGSGISVAGRLADVLAHLEELTVAAASPRPAAAWCELLRGAAGSLFAAPADALWQQGALTRLLRTIEEQSAACDVALTLADVRRLLAERLGGAPGRSDFFRGGITVSSLTPLRGVPHRVVCVLGMDEGAFGPAGADGDDLVTAAPHLGDRDARAETRQALLETVLAAGECLIVTRTGTNVVDNQPVPRAVPLAELRDAVLATVVDDRATRDLVAARLEMIHPRQSFDEENFRADAATGRDPWSFDPIARAGAEARVGPRVPSKPFVDPPLDASDDVIDLGDLQRLLRHPVREFLTRRLELRLPREAEDGSDDLPTSISGLDEWKVADRLLDGVLAGEHPDAWARREAARGSLPPGVLGSSRAATITAAVQGIVAAARDLGHRPGAATRRLVDVALDDGTRIVGAVRDAAADRPGPMQVGYSRFKPQRLLQPWLDLMALVAHDPGTEWQAVLLNRDKSGKGIDIEILRPRGDDPQARGAHAVGALTVAVDCYRRGRREPIPLFYGLSRAVFDGGAKPTDWKNEPMHFGDGYEAANHAVYGELDFHALLALPALDTDPSGAAPGRVARFAECLWGAMRDSTVVIDGRDDDE